MIGLLARFAASGGSSTTSKSIYLITVTAQKNNENITNRFTFVNSSPINSFSGIVNLCNNRTDYESGTLAGVGVANSSGSHSGYFLVTNCTTSNSNLVLRQQASGTGLAINESEYNISINNLEFNPAGRIYQNNCKVTSGDSVIGWITVYTSEPIVDYYGLVGTTCLHSSYICPATGYVKPNNYIGKVSETRYTPSSNILSIRGTISDAYGYRRYNPILNLDYSNDLMLAEWNSVRFA